MQWAGSERAGTGRAPLMLPIPGSIAGSAVSSQGAWKELQPLFRSEGNRFNGNERTPRSAESRLVSDGLESSSHQGGEDRSNGGIRRKWRARQDSNPRPPDS